MTARRELPKSIGDGPFSVAAALEAGVTPDQLRNPALQSPHHGVRSARAIESHADLVRAFVPRMRPWQAVTGLSAAVVLGMPLPMRFADPGAVHVAVPSTRNMPVGRAVRGRRIREQSWERIVVDGVPVTPPYLTWVLLARDVSARRLVVVADALLAAADNYPGLVWDGAAVEPHELRARTLGLGPVTGAPALRAASEQARPGVESPMETLLRLALVEAGFAEPEVNVEIRIGEAIRFRGDLVYPRERVVLEYDGVVHLDRERRDHDIERERMLQDAGWKVIHVTADQLYREVPRTRLFRHLAAALRRRRRP